MKPQTGKKLRPENGETFEPEPRGSLRDPVSMFGSRGLPRPSVSEGLLRAGRRNARSGDPRDQIAIEQSRKLDALGVLPPSLPFVFTQTALPASQRPDPAFQSARRERWLDRL